MMMTLPSALSIPEVDSCREKGRHDIGGVRKKEPRDAARATIFVRRNIVLFGPFGVLRKKKRGCMEKPRRETIHVKVIGDRPSV